MASSYDADNGVMLTGEISQDMLGGYNKTVLQYANKGLAQNMVSQGGGWYDMWNYVNDATGYRVINTGLIPITEKFSINHVLTWGSADDITGQHDAVVSIVQSAVAILFFGGVWHRVVDTEFGPRARPWLPARVA